MVRQTIAGPADQIEHMIEPIWPPIIGIRNIAALFAGHKIQKFLNLVRTLSSGKPAEFHQVVVIHRNDQVERVGIGRCHLSGA